jgi:hypothetical protein
MKELDLISVKLVTGEEIICKFVKQDVVCWVLKDARTLVMMPDGLVRFGQVLFSADKDMDIFVPVTAILVYSDYVRAEFANAYNQAVSPLSLPTKQILKG